MAAPAATTRSMEPPAEFMKPRPKPQAQPAGISDTSGYKGRGRLEGKVVIVTGAAGGIGRTMVDVFAKEGAVVHFSDRRDQEEQGREVEAAVRKAGGRATYQSVDVTHDSELRTWINFVGSTEGRIDAVVPNAAAFVPGKTDEITGEDWDRVLDVNVKGYARTAKHSVPWLRKAGGGAICFIASVASFIAQPEIIPYTVSKGAVVGLMRCLALDLGMENIRVNALCPGEIRTGLTDAHARRLGQSTDKLMEDAARKTFLARVGTTLEVALAAVYLISDESAYTTGSSLIVDGGLTAH